MRSRTTYSRDDKAKAIALAEKLGAREAGEKLGYPSDYIRRWKWESEQVEQEIEQEFDQIIALKDELARVRQDLKKEVETSTKIRLEFEKFKAVSSLEIRTLSGFASKYLQSISENE